MPGARLLGSATLRFLGLRVYDGRLWVGATAPGSDWQATPFALELQYQRNLKGELIAERSLKEMRRQGEIDEVTAERWLGNMKQLFPDVQPGDRITGVNLPGVGARFFVNGQLRGELREVEFARVFFGVWLSPRTSEPAMREQLLGLQALRERRVTRDAPRRAGAAAGRRAWPTAAWGCRWPSWRCRSMWCCPTTTRPSSAFRWPRLGALLLGARLLDAVADPWIGRLVDGWFSRSLKAVLLAAVLAARGVRSGLSRTVLPRGGHTLAGQRRADRPAAVVRSAAGHHLPQLQRAERAAPGLGCAPGR